MSQAVKIEPKFLRPVTAVQMTATSIMLRSKFTTDPPTGWSHHRWQAAIEQAKKETEIEQPDTD